MELHPAAARSLQLRQSYIGISNYVRARAARHGGLSAERIPPQRQTRQSTSSHPNVVRKVWQVSPSALAKATVNQFERSFLKDPLVSRLENATPDGSARGWHALREFDPDSTPPIQHPTGEGHHVLLNGYIAAHRSVKDFRFITLVDPRLELAVQVLVRDNEEDLTEDKREMGVSSPDRRYHHHTPVRIEGMIKRKPASARREGANEKHVTMETRQTSPSVVGPIELFPDIEIYAHRVLNFNPTDPAIVPKRDMVIPPELRHWQFRTDHNLRNRIRLRSRVSGKIREHMLNNDFDEIETPLLFKSTPEGAREFVVPTRKRGMAYALPQSPQQYKQVLMASGIPRYFQFAKCFRDEDLRADRQPEFTQLDLEMAFAGSITVMETVESLMIKAVWPTLPDIAPLPTSTSVPPGDTGVSNPDYLGLSFPSLTYDGAMSRYGSDKPDTRLGSRISRVEGWLPANTRGMMTSIKYPIFEMVKIDMQNCTPAKSREFFTNFIEASTTASYATDEAQQPGVTVYDPLKPLHGLAAFGHEAAGRVEEVFNPEPGDLFLLWGREDKKFTGGSTVLGDLRRDVYHSAISQGLITAPVGFAPLWVTDFPLFSPTTESEPGQGGSAGLCSTHHPFTAPKQNVRLGNALTDDPLSIVGDHYDLVINGVEIGGGSCRIHQAGMQRLILEDILKLDKWQIDKFEHLIKVLQSGCPPHAGFALGFDRLMAMLTNSPSVRDVIAFPKSADGEDKFAGSPTRLTAEQLATYHLAISDPVQKNPSGNSSERSSGLMDISRRSSGSINHSIRFHSSHGKK